MEENHAYESVIGSSAMPYLNSLAHQGALATQYYADVHHSLPDYLELTMGVIPTMDDNYPGVFTQDNLAREIVAAGKTWKTYQEDLPSAGYLGGDTAGYIRHHNPFAYFSDVANDAGQTGRIVPFTQFAADMNSNSLPSFSFVVPSRIHDAHDCGSGAACSDTDLLSQADQWLQANIAPVLGNAQFQNGGLLLIVFDEANLADIRHGGGRVPLIAVGPKARPGAQSATFYQHENTLRTICNLLGLSACPGSGASAAPESDLLR
jgi:acid phosphatase